MTLQKERQVWDRREQDLESAIKRSYEEMASLKKELLTAGNYSKKNNELEMKNKGDLENGARSVDTHINGFAAKHR